MESAELVRAPTIANAKYKTFADAVLRGNNLTDAARVAGFVGKAVGVTASRLANRPEVAEYLRYYKTRQTEEAEVVRAKLLNEFSNVAFSNVADYIRFDTDGEPVIDFSQATREQLSAIRSVKTKHRSLYTKDGSVIGTEKESSFTLWDKIRAGELLGREVGLFKQAEVKVVVDVADRLLSARARVIQAALPSPDTIDATQ